eukprot:2325211-Lingulodinium_polyedra.AAC.1
MRAPVFWRARGVCEACDQRAIAAADGDRNASLCSVLQTLRNDAVKSSVRSRSGSQIARLAHSMRTPKL